MKRTPLTRKTRVKRANRPRKAENFARAYGSPERVAWVQSQPCWVCAGTPSENAHCRTGGMGRKADARYILPLCHHHHNLLHRMGQDSFEESYNMDLEYGASITDARWAQYEAAHLKTQPTTPPEGEGKR